MKLNGFEVSDQGLANAPQADGVFTPQRANAALPLVRRIVHDVVEAFHQAHALHRRVHTLPESAAAEEARELLQARDTTVARLQRLRTELEVLGVELKDVETGLVDFPAQRDGRPVCLCWKLGEERVAYWHHCDAGFVSRRPIA